MAKSGAFWVTHPSNARKAIDLFVYERSRTVAQKLFELVIDLSPVDTGAYRASWTLTEGEVGDGWVGRHRGMQLSPLPAPTMPKISTKFYRKLYVSNNAPYAERLENGWSGQAPSGVARVAMEMLKYV